jgi:hypothetical protein
MQQKVRIIMMIREAFDAPSLAMVPPLRMACHLESITTIRIIGTALDTEQRTSLQML